MKQEGSQPLQSQTPGRPQRPQAPSVVQQRLASSDPHGWHTPVVTGAWSALTDSGSRAAPQVPWPPQWTQASGPPLLTQAVGLFLLTQAAELFTWGLQSPACHSRHCKAHSETRWADWERAFSTTESWKRLELVPAPTDAHTPRHHEDERPPPKETNEPPMTDPEKWSSVLADQGSPTQHSN